MWEVQLIHLILLLCFVEPLASPIICLFPYSIFQTVFDLLNFRYRSNFTIQDLKSELQWSSSKGTLLFFVIQSHTQITIGGEILAQWMPLAPGIPSPPKSAVLYFYKLKIQDLGRAEVNLVLVQSPLLNRICPFKPLPTQNLYAFYSLTLLFLVCREK